MTRAKWKREGEASVPQRGASQTQGNMIPAAVNLPSERMEYSDRELLDMMPAKDADHETWRAYHRLLFEAGKLIPPEQ